MLAVGLVAEVVDMAAEGLTIPEKGYRSEGGVVGKAAGYFEPGRSKCSRGTVKISHQRTDGPQSETSPQLSQEAFLLRTVIARFAKCAAVY